MFILAVSFRFQKDTESQREAHTHTLCSRCHTCCETLRDQHLCLVVARCCVAEMEGGWPWLRKGVAAFDTWS